MSFRIIGLDHRINSPTFCKAFEKLFCNIIIDDTESIKLSGAEGISAAEQLDQSYNTNHTKRCFGNYTILFKAIIYLFMDLS